MATSYLVDPVYEACTPPRATALLRACVTGRKAWEKAESRERRREPLHPADESSSSIRP